MKYLFAAVLALGTVASFSAAEAAGGCGPGWHRGPYGGCQPNRRVIVVRPPAVVVARLRSWWYGRRACPYGTGSGATDAAGLIDFCGDEKPRSRGAFFIPRETIPPATPPPLVTTRRRVAAAPTL